MKDCGGPAGEFLLIIAAIVSIQLSQGRTVDEIVLLSAFLEVVGDNLALIAARRTITEVAAAEDGSCGDRARKELVNSIDKPGISV